MTTYPQFTEELAADLPYLRTDDFITLRGGGNNVQVIQDPDRLTADLYLARDPEPAERDRLIAQGWLPPHPGQPTWTRHIPWPPSAAQAIALATAMIEAARDHLAESPDGLEYNARNYETGRPIDPRSLQGLRRAT